MRTSNSIRNSLAAIFLQIIIVVLSFVVRTVFIKELGIEYLGINGLFSNILSMLSLAELGVGTAIVFSMYKPMAEDNKEKIRILMKVYGRIYKTIGMAIILIGCALVPFLDLLIAGTQEVPNLSIYFMIYILNSAASYFFIYKASIFTVDQKEYKISLLRSLFMIIRYSLEIFVLLVTKNFLFYLLVSLVATILTNSLISYKANKAYPFIKEETKGKLSFEEKRTLRQNISALFFHRIGSVVVNGTDNLIISKIFGLAITGLYSNYLLIIIAINTFVNITYNALTASVGNLNATENKEKNLQIFEKILFSNFWIGGFCSICLVILLNPFITVWIGKEYIFSAPVVLVIVINSYLTIIRKTPLVYRDAMGLFWKDRYKPLFESIINLGFSIILAYQFGIIGVFIGTLIATLMTSFWIEPWILFKYGFNIKVREYFKRVVKYIFITFVAASITWLSTRLIESDSFNSLLYKMLMCIFIPNVFFIICYYKTSEFKFFQDIIITYFKKFFVSFIKR